ncbi:dipeptidyl aminopeptidase/acylaminoacyl peptidase [Rheinheimera pacifica]|uniref:alpha/beta hydrolase family protein n=1 Tax=Rheinheimera pacifica TaxID=173990 RepID=UPI0021693DD7|nr:prolyl oligopeptidase family serine peptidase [Rheinheimera pacifica]MCS4308404.1 dipeptidyl aminopeptidase/acylaminoacyl peptidase [Rheinheimera pacifica]
MYRIGLFLFCCWFLPPAVASTYQQPDQRLVQLVDAGSSIDWQVSASGNWLIQTETAVNPALEVIQQHSVGLAGLHINLAQLSAGLGRGYQQISVQHLQQQKRYQIVAQAHQRLFSPRLSPDDNWLSVVVAEQNGLFIELLELKNGKRKRVRQRLNAVLGIQYQWLADSSGLIAAVAPSASTPAEPAPGLQPKARETTGKKTALRTLQLLLQSESDAAYFEQLIQAKLVRISTRLKSTVIAELPLHSFSLSPDNRFILTQRIVRPYSYRVRYSNFPRQAEVYNLRGEKIAEAGELALHESSKTRDGRRIIAWQPMQPATLYWVEKSDDKASKDALWQWPAPFSAVPHKLYDTAWRFRRVLWSDTALAILYESDSDTDQERAWFFPAGFASNPQLWYQRNSKDHQALPGEPVMANNRYQQRVIQQTDSAAFFATRRNNALQAELHTVQPQSGEQQLIWRSASDTEDTMLQMLPLGGILFTRQTPTQPPELFKLDTDGTTLKLVARHHPAPAYQQITQQWLEYQRSDGVKLSGRLYLPAGYDVSMGPLPVLMWAYPREYASAELAEQRTVPEQRFVSFRPSSAQPYVALGYAVFDQVSMPVISKDAALPNDDFLPQLTANAEAAVDTLVKLGVAERGNIAVGGHSYGAFMVANLLAHTDLFSAGIARSGAYNRSLTPFGFQSEKRNLWQNTALYNLMSPFLHADRMEAPLLLIHGEADANSGTFPLQSERLFEAMQGLGKVARLVLLPYEGHHYQARESVLHVLWEQQQWLARHLTATPAMQLLQPEALAE